MVSEDWVVRYKTDCCNCNGKAGLGRRPRVACWCGKTKRGKSPSTSVISVKGSAN